MGLTGADGDEWGRRLQKVLYSMHNMPGRWGATCERAGWGWRRACACGGEGEEGNACGGSKQKQRVHRGVKQAGSAGATTKQGQRGRAVQTGPTNEVSEYVRAHARTCERRDRCRAGAEAAPGVEEEGVKG
jgi:hypothetical protein